MSNKFLSAILLASAAGSQGAAAEPVANPLQQIAPESLAAGSVERMECAGCALFIYHEDDSLEIINREPGPMYVPGPPRTRPLNDAQIARLIGEFASASPAPEDAEPKYFLEAQFRFYLNDGRSLLVRSRLLALDEDAGKLIAIGEEIPEALRREPDARQLQSADKHRMTAIRTPDFVGHPFLLDQSRLDAIRSIVVEAGCG